jgi:hypothetical protein
MDLLNVLLRSVDGYIDLGKSDTVDQLYVVCIKIMAELMGINQARQIIGVDNEALRLEHRSLCTEESTT